MAIEVLVWNEQNKDFTWITNSRDDRIMLIPPVIWRQWILGGIMVTGLLFSEMLVALPIDEADFLYKPDGYSENLKKWSRRKQPPLHR